jgi:hypothetical protein
METKTVGHIVWQKYDIRHWGKKRPYFSWCADGDGLLAIRFWRGRYRLYNEWQFLADLGSELMPALRIATRYMQRVDTGMYEHLKT